MFETYGTYDRNFHHRRELKDADEAGVRDEISCMVEELEDFYMTNHTIEEVEHEVGYNKRDKLQEKMNNKKIKESGNSVYSKHILKQKKYNGRFDTVKLHKYMKEQWKKMLFVTKT